MIPEQAALAGSPSETEDGAVTLSATTVSSWIEECDKNHHLCRREGTPRLNRRFARILDVGDVPSASTIKLCPSEDLPYGLKYVTLSHTWAGISSEIPYLTTETYDEYLQCIVIANLPRTFQDAIQLTRQMGIRYLWIDSLCIIQDSQEDWSEQVALMNDVYQGSYLNYAADTSINPNEGLLTTRSAILATPLRVPIRGAEIPQDLPPLRLKGTLLLVAEAAQPHASETELDLNTCLGNNDGNFDLNDKDFAWSARNVELVETILHAELRTRSGEWKRRSVDVRELVDIQSDESSLKLVGDSTLIISRFPNTDGLDLNECLANRDGAFVTDGTDFAWTARNVSLNGTNLNAELRKIDGEWRQDSVDLASFISWSSGRLCPPRLGKTFYDVGTNGHAKYPKRITRAKPCIKEWDFEESSLVPRVVYFTDKQFSWECATLRPVERRSNEGIDDWQTLTSSTKLDFESWDPYSVDLLHEPKTRELGLEYIWSSLKAMCGNVKRTFRRKSLAQDPARLRQAKDMCYGGNDWETTHPVIKYWSEIVVSYCAVDLRQANDRLTAVAGLARTLAARTGSRYAAGLWTIQLPRQLLWTSSNSNEMRDEDYTAPSWSWASCPGAIMDGGLTLDPILESKGAMDLIKILSIDIEGVADKDDMPFGQVKDGRLLIRGRLLPIALDLNVWPEGATRENALVQYWTGSTSEIPSGETFLVPVLFTCCDERLSDSTNSLLLESTEEKGVFRRIGTARLNSGCDLSSITPQLYTAECADHSDEEHDDDDGDADDEDDECIEDDGFVIVPTSPTIESHPHQKVSEDTSDDTKYTFFFDHDEASDIATEPETTPDSERTMTPEQIINSTEREIMRWNSLFPQLPKTPEKELDDVDEWKGELGFFDDHPADVNRRKADAGIETRPRKKIQKLAPKNAVASHYYIGYIEDDKDVVRYGHFVFEIR